MLGKRSIKTSAKQQGIRLAVSMTDLTTLEGADTPGKVRHLCAKAVVPGARPSPRSRPARRCASTPRWSASCATRSRARACKAASVATAFPSGQASLEVKLRDTEEAVAAGRR